MVYPFSVKYKTLIILAELLKILPQVDIGLSYIGKYFCLKKNVAKNGCQTSTIFARRDTP